MIYLTANTPSTVCFTLFEKTTLSGATYILNLFSNDNLTNNLYWLTGNTTTNNARFDRFDLTLDLQPGTYDYYVYQFSGGQFNTSALTVDNVVETGLCEVIKSCSTSAQFKDEFSIVTFDDCEGVGDPCEVTPNQMIIDGQIYPINPQIPIQCDFDDVIFDGGNY
jgi:hypothetical protein